MKEYEIHDEKGQCWAFIYIDDSILAIKVDERIKDELKSLKNLHVHNTKDFDLLSGLNRYVHVRR